MMNLTVLTAAETDLLTLAAAVESFPDDAFEVTARNVMRLDDPAAFVESREETDVLLARLIGGRDYYPDLADALTRAARRGSSRVAAVAADRANAAGLRELSSEPDERVRNIEACMAAGGVENFGRILRMLLEDTVLSPATVPAHGVAEELLGDDPPSDYDAALLFYRALYLSGDLDALRDLVERGRDRGLRILPVYGPGVRDREAFRSVVREHLTTEEGEARVDVVLSMLGFSAADPGSKPPCLEGLDVPWLQLIDSSRTASAWSAADGLRPRDRTMKVTLPEFDGRLIGPPVSFQDEPRPDERVGTSLQRRVAHPERVRRALAGLERRLELSRRDNEGKRVAILLGRHPVDRGRLGSAVGLDTPASLMVLLRRLRRAGFDVGSLPDGPEALMEHLAGRASFGRNHEPPRRPADRVNYDRYRGWLEELPDALRESLRETWGDPAGDRRTDARGFPVPGYRAGGLFVGLQPPRGHGQDPGSIYHSPDLTPPHSYVAFYRWITRRFQADAIVHLGKHGNLEWLPGRSTGLGADDWPDALLEGTPLVYPFIINDPGEGAQAKRRAEATVVDHLIAPQRPTGTREPVRELGRALEGEDDGAVLERANELGLVDGDEEELDPAALRGRLRRWLEDVRDSHTRSGLHVLGRLPDDERVVDLLQAVWPEGEAGELSRSRARRAWEDPGRAPEPLGEGIIPDLERTGEELDHVVRALEGRYVPPGPSGSPTRGRPDLLPTGRNFFTRDLRGMPTRTAWERGRRLAERLLERHRERTGEWPRTVGVILWGTSNMRTGGEDVAQVLALQGVRPTWTDSGRVDGVEAIASGRLDRPRVDVVVRISGFFRDAFPNLVDLLAEASRTAINQEDRTACPNYPRRHEDDGSGCTPRVFGSPPESYGAGLLPLIQQGNWDDREDLARTFLNWGDHAYPQGTESHAAPETLRRQLARVEAVTQNRDTREHDLYDSDDYFQFHGGMFAAVETLSDEAPACYFSDTSRPEDIRVRTLREESARVFHNRVRHPVWQEGMRDHGYKGGAEMADTLDYMFGYDAATDVLHDGAYEALVEDFLADETNRSFLEDQNPWALRSMGERLLEAHQRGLWEDPDEASLRTVRRVLRASEEGREGAGSP